MVAEVFYHDWRVRAILYVDSNERLSGGFAMAIRFVDQDSCALVAARESISLLFFSTKVVVSSISVVRGRDVVKFALIDVMMDAALDDFCDWKSKAPVRGRE